MVPRRNVERRARLDSAWVDDGPEPQLRGELVELADLPVEHGGGHVATRLADATRDRSGRVSQLRPLVGGRGDDRPAHERWLVAGLDRQRKLLVEEFAALRVERKGLIGRVR